MEVTIYQRIMSILEDKQLSVNALSKMVNMSQTTLNTQLKGERTLSANVVAKVLDTFPEVSSEWVMRGEGSMYRKEESAEGVEEAISTNMVAEPAPTYHAQPEQDESIWKAKYEAIKECYDMLVSSLGSMRQANVG
jgi:lambda repressor-like predicted transcriptional regulator